MAGFASLAEVKAAENITDSSKDAEITRLLDAVDFAFQKYLDRKLVAAVYTAELHSGGESTIQAKQYPVDTTITWAVREGGDTLVLDTDYVVDRPTGIITRISGAGGSPTTFTAGFLNIELDYVGGNLGSLSDVEHAEIEQVRHWLHQGGLSAGRLGLEGKVLEQGGAAQYAPATLLPEVREILSRYRRLQA